MRLANMEAISVLKDEKSDSKAASAGESRGWPNSREGGLGPGQPRNTRKGNAQLVRQGR